MKKSLSILSLLLASACSSQAPIHFLGEDLDPSFLEEKTAVEKDLCENAPGEKLSPSSTTNEGSWFEAPDLKVKWFIPKTYETFDVFVIKTDPVAHFPAQTTAHQQNYSKPYGLL